MNHSVWLIDDDKAVRDSLSRLLASLGYDVAAFEYPEALRRDMRERRPNCLLIDLQLPQMSGLQLIRLLAQDGNATPCVMISGHGDISTAVESMHEGAVDFLEKPCDRSRLLQCVEQAIKKDLVIREATQRTSQFESRLETLTSREHEVMELVARGMLTKQIAKLLSISVKTVEVHRSRITKKLGVRSMVELVRSIAQYEFDEQILLGPATACEFGSTPIAQTA